MTEDRDISFKAEIIRKSIHMLSLCIPIIYIFVSRETGLWILVPMALTAVAIDLLSKRVGIINHFMQKVFGPILRPFEYEKKLVLNGASWVLISAVVCVFIFPKIFFITGFIILIISDICAAIFGKRFGKHKVLNKSWEGTAAFIISAIFVVLILGAVFQTPYTYYIFGIAAAVIGGFVELISGKMKIDDNLSIPISIGLALWGGNYLAVEFFNLPYIAVI